MQNRTGASFDSGSYTDLNRLSQLKVGERDSDANVRKVAQEFESLFLNQMLKSMRAASDALADQDSPFNSQAALQYRDMYDQQMSVSLARDAGGIGLADVLTRQLSQRRGSAPVEGPAAGAAVSNTSLARSLPRPAEGRDDSHLLNLRRLALPARAIDRQRSVPADPAATPTALAGNAPLVQGGWKPAQTFAVPADKPLTVNGEAPTKSQTRFSSAEEFVATMLPMAEKAARRLGVEARYLVAQAALETGWGKHMIRQRDGSNSHNLFGIKATAWKGEQAQASTTEYVGGKAVRQVAGFRAYDSFEQSFNDFVSLLENNSRYRKALQVASSSGDSERFVRELQSAGYATDPHYARKISQIARKMQTYQAIAETGGASSLQSRG